ncbi:MAG TPA: sulfotransferase [Caulobacteraceae bacterium]|nr:sulfotransferase [Caulobacteraceae bacterium]
MRISSGVEGYRDKATMKQSGLVEADGASRLAYGVGRNDPCPCGSGLKFKKCCQDKQLPADVAKRATSRTPSRRPSRDDNLHITATAHWEAGNSAEAIAAFRKIAVLQPESADAHSNLGAALAVSGRLAESVPILQRALELRPSFEAALRNLSSALEHLGRDREAAATLRRLSRVTKDLLERRLTLASALSLEGATGEAEAELRRAVAASPGSGRAQALLGRLLLERGEFEEAEHCLIKAIDEFPDAFQQLATSRRMTSADRPLIERIAKRLEQGDLNPLQRCTVHFGLGKAYDDLGEYEEAIAQFELGNALRYKSARLDRDGLRTIYDDLISHYSAAELEASRASQLEEPRPDDDLPILIVGMPRSGTTLVEQIVSSHPDVAAGGELSFWRDRLADWLALSKATLAEPNGAATGPDQIARLLASRPVRSAAERAGRASLERPAPKSTPMMAPALLSQAAKEYKDLLRRIGPRALRVTDKAPFNFERLGQILTALPAVRVIYCRRQPVDNCLSIFFTNYQGRQAWSRDDILYHYRQHQRLVAHWRSVLTPDRFIEVDYEDVVADREGQTRRLIDFCGLEWNDACLAPEENRRVVKTASVWQARQPTYTRSLDRWRHYKPWLGELRELLTADA